MSTYVINSGQIPFFLSCVRAALIDMMSRSVVLWYMNSFDTMKFFILNVLSRETVAHLTGGGAKWPWPLVKLREGEKANTPPFDNFFFKFFQKT